jgi:hypothetical protein
MSPVEDQPVEYFTLLLTTVSPTCLTGMLQ